MVLALPIAEELESAAFVAVLQAEDVSSRDTEASKLLDKDDIATVYLYTIDSPLYRQVNEILRNENRSAAVPYFPFLRRMLEALNKLKRQSTILYRGVRTNLASEYPKGRQFFWWQFTSCTSHTEVLEESPSANAKG